MTNNSDNLEFENTRRQLIAKRNAAGADEPDGHTYSNLVELTKNRMKAAPGAFELQHLPRLIEAQLKRLPQRNDPQ